jgi:hypothetical protein
MREKVPRGKMNEIEPEDAIATGKEENSASEQVLLRTGPPSPNMRGRLAPISGRVNRKSENPK